MAYQIRFENQPSATAPAQKIVITDTLDPNLDLSTFELTEITFANQIIPVPMGLNHYEARLPFTAVTNQQSAFVTLSLDDTVGLQPDGTAVRNFAAQSGRVVVIGEEPLVEALHAEMMRCADLRRRRPDP